MSGTCTTRYPVSVRGSALLFVASAGENYFRVRYCISIGRQLKGTRTSLKILQKFRRCRDPCTGGYRVPVRGDAYLRVCRWKNYEALDNFIKIFIIFCINQRVWTGTSLKTVS